jgi:hypothetical protein
VSKLISLMVPYLLDTMHITNLLPGLSACHVQSVFQIHDYKLLVSLKDFP